MTSYICEKRLFPGTRIPKPTNDIVPASPSSLAEWAADAQQDAAYLQARDAKDVGGGSRNGKHNGHAGGRGDHGLTGKMVNGKQLLPLPRGRGSLPPGYRGGLTAWVWPLSGHERPAADDERGDYGAGEATRQDGEGP